MKVIRRKQQYICIRTRIYSKSYVICSISKLHRIIQNYRNIVQEYTYVILNYKIHYS